jgi:hypothetical protein
MSSEFELETDCGYHDNKMPLDQKQQAGEVGHDKGNPGNLSAIPDLGEMI